MRLVPRILALAFLAGLVAPGPADAQDEHLFPGRGSSLGPGQWWSVSEFSEGANILDLHVRRWDAELNRWTRRRPGISQADYDAAKTNDKHLAYGLPLYAPVDGEIISCWRNAPDNPVPGEKRPDVVGSGSSQPKRISLSANHVLIHTGDGNDVLVAHLKPGSVPSALCPHDGDLLQDATNKDADGYLVETFIPAGSRPLVRRNDFVGQVGNSGNSGGPHVHIHISPPTGSAIPFLFYGAWHQPLESTQPSSTGWQRLDRRALNCKQFITNADGDQVCTDGQALIWPSPFLRRGEASAGAVTEVAVESAGENVVTAVRDGSGNLKLIGWSVSSAGAIERRGEASAGAATRIALAHPGLTRDLVTALADDAGNLKLIGWDVSQGGSITRRGQASAGAVDRIAMTRSPIGLGVVTAVRTASGDLKLIVWETQNGAREIVRRGEASAGAIGDVAIASVVDGRGRGQSSPERFTGVVTAVRDGAGNLKLIAWEMSPSKQLVRRGDASAGRVGAVSIATVRVSNLREVLVTAVRDADGNLRVIGWEIDAAGNLTRRDTEAAGPVGDFVVHRMPQPGGRSPLDLVVVLRDASGDLKIVGWEVDASGRLRRQGDVAAGAVRAVSAVDLTRSGRTHLVGAFRIGSGELKLIDWEVNLE